MPVAIAFIVETDGRLPTGMPFKGAIEDELGALVRDLRKPYPHFNIVGDCSGFDMWHKKRILEEANAAY
jgi:hypothetical protein